MIFPTKPSSTQSVGHCSDITLSASLFFRITSSVTFSVFIYEGMAYNLMFLARVLPAVGKAHGCGKKRKGGTCRLDMAVEATQKMGETKGNRCVFFFFGGAHFCRSLLVKSRVAFLHKPNWQCLLFKLLHHVKWWIEYRSPITMFFLILPIGFFC